MRLPSGTTDQYVYFEAYNTAGSPSLLTGLSSFTVYRSRNGGASAAMTTPTINETDSSNMPGVYELLLDEDMVVEAGNDSEEMIFYITHSGMKTVVKTIELYAATNASIAASVLTSQMPESYAANGIAPSLAQAIFAVHQRLMNFGISGTTHRTYQLDSVSTAFDATLDDATNPTTMRRL